jgi:hypothetical protein
MRRLTTGVRLRAEDPAGQRTGDWVRSCWSQSVRSSNNHFIQSVRSNLVFYTSTCSDTESDIEKLHLPLQFSTKTYIAIHRA